MICRGCNKEKNLVKAHIIPESFFRDLRGDEATLHLVSNTEGVHTKKAPIGVYDKEILCEDCEKRFQDADDYAAKVLLDSSALEELKKEGSIIGYVVRSVDYELLKRFVISVLWRASISNQNFYSKVSLGELEEQAKGLIWSGSSGEEDDFSFVLAKFEDTGTISKAMLDPHQEEWEGKKYYRFYMGGFVLCVKADSGETPHTFAKFIPKDTDLFVVSRGKIEESKEFPVLQSGFDKKK